MTPSLGELLRWRRPAGSRTERKFLRRFLPPSAWPDGFGNWHVVIGDRPILFSCHTDTVHRSQGKQNIWQRGDFLRLPDGTKSNCLGADDTVGLWIMLSMIEARIPGRYVFHYGEERGGIGSRGINRSDRWKETLGGYKACIAFDRAGYSDVITHQSGGRCCSDAFAKSLASALNLVGPFLYEPSSHGVYTDSAEYTDAIGECTNLSVGYFHQHTASEVADLGFAHDLRDALISVEWDTALVYERKPGERDTEWDDWPWLYESKYWRYGRETKLIEAPKKSDDVAKEWEALSKDIAGDGVEDDDMTEADLQAWRDEVKQDPRGCPFCAGDGCYCCADFSVAGASDPWDREGEL